MAAAYCGKRMIRLLKGKFQEKIRFIGEYRVG
jgi:hypothetical protein